MTMHDVRFDPQTRRVVIRASGFWNDAELAAFAKDARAAFDMLAHDKRPVDILADLEGYQPQSQQVLGHHDFLGTAGTVKIARHAVVTSSALLRLQMRRFYEGIPTDYFDDRASALAWLGWHASEPILAG
jgi:hypothetical protein